MSKKLLESGTIGFVVFDLIRKLRPAVLLYLCSSLHALPQSPGDFKIEVSGAPSTLASVLAVQADGKILVGGSFSAIGGQPRTNIARLSASGSVDPTFNPGVSSLLSLGIQTDGRILMAGDFTNVAGISRSNLARVYPDGSLDLPYNPEADGAVMAMALQPDGKLLVGGTFHRIGGQFRDYIARLVPDGTIDGDFHPNADSAVYSLALESDGHILVGGAFSALAGQPCARIGRLDSQGNLDSTFKPRPDSNVYGISVQHNGKILITGDFRNVGGLERPYLGRMLHDGTLDPGFDSGAQFWPVVFLQTDGSALSAGDFSVPGGHLGYNVWKLNSDGSPDPSSAWEYPASALTRQADGRILVAGAYDGTKFFVQGFMNPEPAVESLTFTTSSVTWLREGAGPEVGFTTFEKSADGVNWQSLGAGSPINGGWTLSGLSLAETDRVRARGCVNSQAKFTSTSTWFIESEAAASPSILAQPKDLTVRAGDNVAFRVSASGADPLTYQWRKDGVDLAGESSAVLTFTNVQTPQAGSYSVVVSNKNGFLTSSGASLAFVESPVILEHPLNAANVPGTSRTFVVVANGSMPLGYQWFKDDDGITGATNSTFTIGEVQGSDVGTYRVVVSNAHGKQSSLAAHLQTASRPFLSSFSLRPPNLYVKAGPCRRVVIEASTDAQEWSDLYARRVGYYGELSFNFTDTSATNKATRFYRLRQE